MVNMAKLYLLKLVPKLKTNKLLKLLLVDMNSRILMRLERDGRDDTKQVKMPYFHSGPLTYS